MTGEIDKALRVRWSALKGDQRGMYEAVALSLEEEEQKERSKTEQRIPEFFLTDQNIQNHYPTATQSMTSVSLYIYSFS
jgi:hypothetical protein